MVCKTTRDIEGKIFEHEIFKKIFSTQFESVENKYYFNIQEWRGTTAYDISKNYIDLEIDDWDDYNYKTSFKIKKNWYSYWLCKNCFLFTKQTTKA